MDIGSLLTGAYKVGQMYWDRDNRLKQTATQYAIDIAQKGVGMLGGLASTYNQWRNDAQKRQLERKLVQEQIKAMRVNNKLLAREEAIRNETKRLKLNYDQYVISGQPYQLWKQGKLRKRQMQRK